MNPLLLATKKSTTTSIASTTGNPNTVMLVAGEASPSLTSGLSNAIGDTSSNALTLTATGTSTKPANGTFTPYGTNWSTYLPGSSYLAYSTGTNLSFGTADFTVEMWIFMPTAQGNTNGTSARLLDARSSSATGFSLGLNDSGTTLSTLGWQIGTNAPSFAVGQPIVGQWNHIAVVRHSLVTTLYLNGVLQTSVADTNNYVSATTCYVGSSYNLNNTFAGHISNLRIVNGTAVYTSAFTLPTSQLTAVTNTALLVNGYNFTDSSGKNNAVAATGTPTITRFSPFTSGGPTSYSPSTTGTSTYFNGSSYLYNSTGSFSSMDFGTGDFTVEMWVFMTAGTSSAGYTLIDTRNSSMAGNGYVLWLNTSNVFTQQFNAGTANSAGSVVPYCWNHVAWSRKSGTARMFLNGTLVRSYADTNNYTTNAVYISRNNENALGYITGYLADLRVTSSGLYTANFTPPTSPLSASTGTTLLLGSQTTGNNWCEVYDSTGNSNVYVAGSAISNTQSKFNGTSLNIGSTLANANYDFGTAAAASLLSFGTGNFTVEAWVFTTSLLNGSPSIIDTHTTGSNGWYMGIGYNFNNSVYWVAAGTIYETLTGAITLNTWNHIAIVRNNGTTTAYLNGVAGTSFSDATSYAAPTGQIGIGTQLPGVSGSPYCFPGYISDARVTKAAVYTANFTPPTGSFVGK
jgi:hypothetical protein